MKLVRFERRRVDFEAIDAPATVRRLEIAFCDLESLAGVERLSKLEEVLIHYARRLRDVSSLGDLPKLRKVVLYGLPKLERMFPLQDAKRLEYLSFVNVTGLGTLSGIEKLKRLEYLGLSRTKVADGDYSPVVACKSLQRVFWVGAPFAKPTLQEIRRLRPDLKVGGNNVA